MHDDAYDDIDAAAHAAMPPTLIDEHDSTIASVV